MTKAKNELTEVVQDIGTTAADPFVQMVERLATNEQVDADKLEKLVDVQIRILDRNAEIEFNQAMADVQANLPQVAYDAQNDHTRSRYARHEAIVRAIKPIYTSLGFSTSFSQGDGPDGFMRIVGVLRHRGGHHAEYFVDLPADDRGSSGNVNKTALHAAGSTFTYGRRYLTCLMFDVATGDDTDGAQPVPVLTDTQVADLQAKAEELFGDKYERVLQSLAQKRFHLADGNWKNIPAYRLGDAVRSLDEKAGAST